MLFRSPYIACQNLSQILLNLITDRFSKLIRRIKIRINCRSNTNLTSTRADGASFTIDFLQIENSISDVCLSLNVRFLISFLIIDCAVIYLKSSSVGLLFLLTLFIIIDYTVIVKRFFEISLKNFWWEKKDSNPFPLGFNQMLYLLSYSPIPGRRHDPPVLLFDAIC